MSASKSVSSANELDDEGCKRTAGRDLAGAPWEDTARVEEKECLARYVAGSPEGVPLVMVVRNVFNDGRTGYSNTDYQLTRRFFERHDEFQIDRRDGNLWVEPTLDHFTRSAGKQDSETPDGDEVSDQQTKWAKDRARARVMKAKQIPTQKGQQEFLGELLTERASTEENVVVQERIRGTGPIYNTVPHATRFNDPSRARRVQQAYEAAWKRATTQYDRGVMVTLTTDPNQHDSLGEATEELVENSQRLHDWLATNPTSNDEPERPGHRLDYIAVPEFTGSGIPHLHIVFFGVGWVVPHWRLAKYWSSQRGQGKVVYLQSLWNHRGKWVPHGRVRGDGHYEELNAEKSQAVEPCPVGRSVQSYLGKMVATLVAFANRDISQFTTEDHDGTRVSGTTVTAAESASEASTSRTWWKLALYWVLDKQFWTASERLRRRDRSPVLPPVPCWRRIGAAELAQLPGYVRTEANAQARAKRNGTGLRSSSGRLPPPDSSETTVPETEPHSDSELLRIPSRGRESQHSYGRETQ